MKADRSPKTFKVEPWTGEGEGEKVVGYGRTGIGKTTLFALMPHPIYIGIDDGGRRIKDPKTGKSIDHIPDITCYRDVRDALHQDNLWPVGSSCIIDTCTDFESKYAAAHVLDTVSLPKGGGKAANLKSFGWNDGSSHVLDAMRLFLQDLDALIRRGVNVGLVCQEATITVANAGGVDFLQACPMLHHDRQYSAMLEVCAWADHVFRIGFHDTTVVGGSDDKVGKIKTSSSQRAIYVAGAQHFMAKSRTLGRFRTEEGEPIEVIQFENPDDDTLWQFIFPQE